ncbi:hypothetical protein V8C44DRAFT_339432 [Trichoderma aethiopicum]
MTACSRWSNSLSMMPSLASRWLPRDSQMENPCLVLWSRCSQMWRGETSMLFRSDLRFAEGIPWGSAGVWRSGTCLLVLRRGALLVTSGGARRSSIKSRHSATSTAQPQRYVLNKWLRGAGSSALQYLMPLVLYSTSTGRSR